MACGAQNDTANGGSGASYAGDGGVAAAGGMTQTGGTTASSSGGAPSGGAAGAPLSAAGAGGTPSGGAAPAGGAGGTAGAGEPGGAGGPGGSGGASSTGGAPSYDPCPPKGTVCAIMPMGDSITEGFRSSTYGGYRSPLFHLSLVDKKSITFVGSAPLHGPAKVDGVTFPQENEGIGGRRIADLVAIVPQTIVINKPNILLLEIGTNDIGEGATSMASQLGALLDKIIAADPKLMVVVATVIPTTTDSKTAVVKAYDDSIPALIKSRADAGKHIMLVDMFGTFTTNAKYKTAYFRATDELHPNDTGYALMADVWYAGIKSFLP